MKDEPKSINFDLVFAFCILSFPILFLISLWILGPDSIFQIHDNLDSEITFRTVLKDSGLLFSASNDSFVSTMLGGIPRNAFNVPAYNFGTLWYGILTPISAYILNHTLVILLALIGCFGLCLRVIFSTSFSWRYTASALLATSFAMQPVYSIYGIGIAAIPLLLLFAHLMKHSKNRLVWFAGILFSSIYPFYSSIVLGGFAVILMGIFIACYLYFTGRKSDLKIVLCLLIPICILYPLAELALFKHLLFHSGFISHRTEWDISGQAISLSNLPIEFLRLLAFGQYHSPFPAHVAILIGLIIIPILHYNNQLYKAKSAGYILLIGIGIALFAAIFQSQLFLPVRNSFQILKVFAFDRFYFLFPIIWILWEGTLIAALVQVKPKLHILAITLLVLQLCFTIQGNKILPQNFLKILGNPRHSTLPPGWSDFFADHIFQDIERSFPEIKQHGVIGSVALYPAIPSYHGYTTIDGYHNNYPLSYKHQFREIIADELKASPKYQKYFDEWGSRCYLFSHELPGASFSYLAKDSVITDLRLNHCKLQGLGATHLFSGLRIAEPAKRNLYLLGQFTQENRPSIFVYQVIKDSVCQESARLSKAHL